MFLLTYAVVPLFLFAAIYTGFRFFIYLKLLFPRITRTKFWLSYLLLPVSYLLPQYLQTSWVDKLLVNLGNHYMAMLIIAFPLIVLLDFVRLFLYFAKKLPKQKEVKAKSITTAGTAIIVITAILFGYGFYNAQTVDNTRYSIKIQKESRLSGLKAVMLGDLHIGYQEGASKVRKVVEAVNEQNPDIVFIVGDTLDGGLDEVFDIDEVKSELSKINSKYGVFAVLGNHDPFGPDTEGFLGDCGIQILADDVFENDYFIVLGRNDRNPVTFEREGRVTVEKLLEKYDKSKPVIVLDHRPEEIEGTRMGGADLLLSGHSHAGQTFPIMFITDSIYDVDYGLKKFGNMNMIVTSGAGLWGPSTRIGTQCEIVTLDIVFEK